MNDYGIISFIYNGKHVSTYIHFDSQPGNLGVDLVEEIRTLLKKYGSVKKLAERIFNLEIVTQESPIYDIDLKILGETKHEDMTWKRLLYHTSGSVVNMIESGYLLDCGVKGCTEIEQYNYILDFDQCLFKVEPEDVVFPLNQIPEDWPPTC